MLEQMRQAIQVQLESSLEPISNPHLKAAMGYSLLAAGKRIRPLLVLGAIEAAGATPWQTGLPAACALELVHTYSLIHDDLPAMDNDDLRRGQPTNHKQFDEATAILAGDALQTLAFEQLTLLPNTVVGAAVRTLAQAAGANGMVGGQVMDMDGQQQTYAIATLKQLHAQKTGALIEAALHLGGLIGGADAATAVHLRAFGQAFGVAFQIKDDILDATKSSAELGKTANKDVAEGKNTYVALLGLDGAKAALAEQAAQAEAALVALGKPSCLWQVWQSFNK